MKNIFNYGKGKLTIGLAMALTDGRLGGRLCTESIENIRQSAANVTGIVEANEVVYGINTGFGALCDTMISAEDTSRLQHNLLMSHAVGVGRPIPQEIAKT